MRESLKSLPPTLDETYDRIIGDIREEDSTYAARILQWLAFSLTPLSIEEVTEIVAIDVEHEPVFDHEAILIDANEVLDICSGLITLQRVEENPQIRVRAVYDEPQMQIQVVLAHYSVKEYLNSKRSLHGKVERFSTYGVDCNDLLARSCLHYLLRYTGRISDIDVIPSRLLVHALENWFLYAGSARGETEKWSLVAADLLTEKTQPYRNWFRLYDINELQRRKDPFQRFESVSTPAYCAASLGLPVLVDRLARRDGEINEYGGYYGGPLLVASLRGYQQIVQDLLLKHNADPNTYGCHGFTPLQSAAWGCYEQIVELLIGNGADPNTVCFGGNALLVAVGEGYKRLVEVLLNKGANPNKEGMSYFGAPHKGDHAIKRLLEKHGVEMKYYMKAKDTPLTLASVKGHEQVVEILLTHGANPNSFNGKFYPYHRSKGLRDEVYLQSMTIWLNLYCRFGRGFTILYRASKSYSLWSGGDREISAGTRRSPRQKS